MLKIIKKRKVKKSKELKCLGFLIPTAKITQGMRRNRGCLGGLDRCDFDGECDFCKKPRNGSYAAISRGCDYEEVDFYICGKCAVKTYYRNYIAQLQEWQGWAEYAHKFQQEEQVDL